MFVALSSKIFSERDFVYFSRYGITSIDAIIVKMKASSIVGYEEKFSMTFFH
jgi:hypothetical protein